MTPIEARCDHCKQTRRLFLYEPDHEMHLVPTWCEWCERDKQPLLCARCWEKERLREENAPLAPGEAEAIALFYRLSANNSRLIARAEADREACEGIARATDQAT